MTPGQRHSETGAESASCAIQYPRFYASLWPKVFGGLNDDCFNLFLSTSGCRSKKAVLLRSKTVKVEGLMTQHRSRS